MAKNAFTDWSATAGDNTDIGGISIAENATAVSDLNNAIRAIMGQLASGVAAKQSSILDTTAGRGLIVGAFGMGTQNNTVSDFDDAVIPGLYGWTSTSIANRPPTLSRGTFVVGARDSSQITQFAVSEVDGEGVAWRSTNDGGSTWSSWRQINATYGSNGDGSFIRFPSAGVQVCWSSKSGTTDLTGGSAGMWRNTATIAPTFPAAFSASPIIVASPFATSNGAATVQSVAISANTTTASVVLWRNSSQTSVGYTYSYVAIGLY